MTKPFRPMLATDADLEKLRFPLLASAKLDGIRAIVRDGVVWSRSNKPIPNKHVQTLFKPFEHFDGELIVGDPTSKTVYRDTVSGVMSEDGEPAVRLFVFDHVEHQTEKYMARSLRVVRHKVPMIVTHEQVHIASLDKLLLLEERMLNQGYEGLILRDPEAPYKQGRSTVKEGYLLKLKRMATDEAEIIGFIEEMTNLNVATISETGHTKRSSHKANKVGKGRLGALQVRWGDVEFEIGTGFCDAEKEAIWLNQDKYLGKLVSFNHFPIGAYDKPRHPSYKGLRSPIDL